MATWKCKFCKTGRATGEKKPIHGGYCTKRPRLKNKKMQRHAWVKEKK